MCSGGGGCNIKTLEISSRIYITRQDPANLSSGWDLSAKSQVGSPAASGDSCVAKATKSRQRHRRGSAVSPGTPPPKPVRWEPGGAGHLLSMWLRPSPDCRGLNFVTSLFLTRTLPRARRHGLSSWAGPLLLAHSGDIFRFWVTFPWPSI